MTELFSWGEHDYNEAEYNSFSHRCGKCGCDPTFNWKRKIVGFTPELIGETRNPDAVGTVFYRCHCGELYFVHLSKSLFECLKQDGVWPKEEGEKDGRENHTE
ncbi:MAG: hypothetical protein PHT40_04095 [Patescibacteria group bacterium]|nr:hypothetical protein [Patescibacteria group bacterium]